jgi:hypothetical protein
MKIQIQIIKVYQVDIEGGDVNDSDSVNAHISMVERMQSTEIEDKGKLINVTTDYAEVVVE